LIQKGKRQLEEKSNLLGKEKTLKQDMHISLSLPVFRALREKVKRDRAKSSFVLVAFAVRFLGGF
jgi:hypothetical protein